MTPAIGDEPVRHHGSRVAYEAAMHLMVGVAILAMQGL